MNEKRSSSLAILLSLNLVFIFCCFFNAISSEEIAASPCQSMSSQDTIEKMLNIAGVRAGMVIGEIGSGGGSFTYRLAERVENEGKIYANDIDRKALDAIKQKGIPNIETVLGDVDDPLFPVLNLDMIIMRSVFHDLEYPLSMLENLKRYLNPGAPTVIIEQLPTANPPYHVMTQEQLLGIIQKSSFELTRMETSLPSRWVVYFCRVNQVIEPRVWANWLKDFKNEASRLDAWERTPTAYPDIRRIAWERLLDSFRDNNPSTEEDERLRKSIAERIGLLNSQLRQASGIRERADDRGTREDAAGIRLRTEYKTMEIEEISALMRRLGFQAGGNGRYTEGGDFQNHFEKISLAGDDVIIDHATGLMWHRSGSEKPLKYFDALEWTADLNMRAYAGYSDWRIPTIDEVVSLFETKKTNGKLQIDAVFSATQTYVWTGDAPYSGRLWAAVFGSSSLWEELKTNPAWVRPVRSMR